MINVLCVIPARGGSKRVPDKNIRKLLGKPLIAYTIEKALASKLSDKVVVSTDDPKIAGVAKEYGADVIMRPADLASDSSPIDDALRHAVRFFEREEGFLADIVVLLQANVPVRKEGEIDEIIDKLIKTENATAVVTGYTVDQRPEWMKVLDVTTGMIKPFMKPTDLYRKQDLPELYLIDGAIIAARTKAIMEAEGIKTIYAYLGQRVYLVVHETKYSVEIDNEEDFEIAEYYLTKDQVKKDAPRLSEGQRVER
jgi:CMP-N-acetylneuraminic acid synthetase